MIVMDKVYNLAVLPTVACTPRWALSGWPRGRDLII